jgi:hypothetical protein
MAQANCSELAATITQIALNIGSRPHIKDLDGVVAEMQKAFPEFTRPEVVNAINEATVGQARAASELAQKLDALKREARGDVALQKRITELKGHLDEGTLPEGRPRRDAPEAIAELRAARDELMKELRRSDPD